MFVTTAFDSDDKPCAFGFGETEEEAVRWCKNCLCEIIGSSMWDNNGRRLPRYDELLNGDDPFAPWILKTEQHKEDSLSKGFKITPITSGKKT